MLNFKTTATTTQNPELVPSSPNIHYSHCWIPNFSHTAPTNVAPVFNWSWNCPFTPSVLCPNTSHNVHNFPEHFVLRQWYQATFHKPTGKLNVSYILIFIYFTVLHSKCNDNSFWMKLQQIFSELILLLLISRGTSFKIKAAQTSSHWQCYCYTCLCKYSFILDDVLICCEQHIELGGTHLALYITTHGWWTLVCHNHHRWGPLLKL